MPLSKQKSLSGLFITYSLMELLSPPPTPKYDLLSPYTFSYLIVARFSLTLTKVILIPFVKTVEAKGRINLSRKNWPSPSALSPLLKTSPPTNRTGSRKCLNTNLLLLFLPIFFTNSLVGAKSQLSLLKLKFVFQAQAENWTFYYSDTFNHYGGKGHKKVSFFSDKFVWFSKWSVSVTRWYFKNGQNSLKIAKIQLASLAS